MINENVLRECLYLKFFPWDLFYMRAISCQTIWIFSPPLCVLSSVFIFGERVIIEVVADNTVSILMASNGFMALPFYRTED
jgi:hypothetical protein